MDLDILPAQESDLPSLMEIQFSAFENDPYHQALFPGDHFSPSTLQAAGERTLQDWRSDPTGKFMKCVDRHSGRVLGFARWNFYEREREEREWKQKPVVDWCDGRGKEVAEMFLGRTAEMRWRVWEGRRYLLLNLLCVHRGLHRKGAGTALVQWGLEQSERLGLPAYLEASPMGYHLYRKLGFTQIDTMVVKAEEWDGDVDKHYIVMLRNPSGGGN